MDLVLTPKTNRTWLKKHENQLVLEKHMYTYLAVEGPKELFYVRKKYRGS